MKSPLNTYQRRFAEHSIVFGARLLSPDLRQFLFRASLACAENGKTETGVIDFICGLYLQNPDEIVRYFRGDFSALISRNFPVHRFGDEGLMLNVMRGQKHPGYGTVEGIGFLLKYSDDLLELLWLSAQLANAVGEAASLKDVVAAVACGHEWTDELRRSGLTASRTVADFDRDVGAIVFFASVHTSEGRPRSMDFDQDSTILPPFTVEISTPSGPFQRVRSAKVELNGNEVASIVWPGKAFSKTCVELQASNKIEFELDSPPFGGIDVIVRGIAVHLDQKTK